MKEITRIHIAKVSYDVELDAKKDIQKYINTVEAYAEDKELLEDIEIRITELLAERNVLANGVITRDDVAAIREQLGEPEDFLPEGDIAVGKEAVEFGPEVPRKLYRDKDSAVLGGVLSGIAQFFRIDSVWVRVVFIILLFISFGTVALIYVVLWIAVPPARTAAEKLQMSGQPVTLGSIREQNEKDEQLADAHRRAGVVRRIIMIGLGVLGALATIGALLITIWGSIIVFHIGYDSNYFGVTLNDPIFFIAAIAMIISGLLLTALFSILTYAAFTRSYAKRLVVATVVIIISGVVSTALAGSLVAYGGWQSNEQIRRDLTTKTTNLPQSFMSVKELSVKAGIEGVSWGNLSNMHVEYVVSETPRYEFTALPGVTPKVSVDGSTVTITANYAAGAKRFAYQPTLKIYGPALTKITATSGSVLYSAGQRQEQIEIAGDETASVRLYGSYGRVVARGSGLYLSNSSIVSLNVQAEARGTVEAGNVRELTVQQPDVCPGSNGDLTISKVIVESVASGVINYNGEQRAAQTIRTSCGSVVIGSDTEFWESEI